MDLCGFTAFVERNGDEHAVLVLAELRTAMRESAARRGVRIVKWLGDGAMLSSAMPDAVAALVAEIDVRMATSLPSLAVRAGMDRGPVIMFEGDDYIGRPVNVAARLCDAADPRELLATESVIAHLPRWMAATPTTLTTVRGLHADLAVAGVRIEADGDAVTDPVCGLTIPRSAAIRKGSEWFCSRACAGADELPR
ncbi:MAG TPA: adenylate/guanylate cyclase domain-containing protein [Acidimicrobiales bacterium]|jgi:class 3 adenylate cyclase|nr:adenylate/guanylate cyclase domain-containing protein [Acidimicrobiales bacterium]